jgi:pimeloyl-ACP methyl ester carboxylesterase
MTSLTSVPAPGTPFDAPAPVPAPVPALGTPSVPRPAVVRSHSWEGFHCESRLVRTTAPRLAPLLMIGGAFQRKEAWGRIEREFLAHMDVLTLDPPGWGAGDLLPGRYDVGFLADAVHHMVDENGLKEINLLGGSYGTAIAYRLAQRYPERVVRMVLIGTMTSIPEHARAAMRRTMGFLAERRMEEYAEAAVDILMNVDRLGSVVAGAKVRRFLLRRLARLPEVEAEQTYTNTWRLLNHEMVDTSCPPVPPALVVAGEHDSFTTPDLCRAMASVCGESWFAEVSGADHMLFLERTVELVDLATRFFADRPLSGLPYCRTVEQVRRPAEAVRQG